MPTVSCLPGHKGQLQFRADAVDARNQHRLFHARKIQAVHGAKAADILENIVVKGAFYKIFDRAQRLIGRVNIDPGVTVTEPRLFFRHGAFLIQFQQGGNGG